MNGTSEVSVILVFLLGLHLRIYVTTLSFWAEGHPGAPRKAKSIEAALQILLGPDATGFAANTLPRLKSQWAAQYDDWPKADLSRDEWVYVWAVGIYSGLRGSDDRLCVLVVIGVNALGEKHFLTIEDGIRESTQTELAESPPRP